VIVYSDFECPYCAAASAKLSGSALQVVFRHFPVRSSHPRAWPAACAAEAASLQGRFWEMHDLLFENQRRLEPDDLLAYAQALGLDTQRFARDLEERTYEPKVRADFLGGVRSGVNGTPTFFVNGVRHNGGWDLPSLLEAIRESI
jgi:protein-disulfide isomerase